MQVLQHARWPRGRTSLGAALVIAMAACGGGSDSEDNAANNGPQVSPTAVFRTSIAAGSSTMWSLPPEPAGRYTVSISGLTGDVDLRMPQTGNCLIDHTGRGGPSPEDCTFDHPGGAVLLQLSGVTAASLVVALFATPSTTARASETAVIAFGVPTIGSVGARGTSTYSSTGLTPGRYTIGIAALDQDADLHIYTDATYSNEYDCTLRSAGDVLPVPEDCTVSSGGDLYFRVGSGELNNLGASYSILITAAP